ncbi:MAG TPA: CBS domain-containing protein [Rhodospirillaceae bacterium]|nr:CBS domain-containing protein [Rhodospirillaceae bacterium]
MTEHPVLIGPDATLYEAAQKMKEIDCGMLPVGTDKKLEGIITDRDIIIRAISQGKDPKKECVKDYMTKNVYACNENDFLEDAADRMRSHAVGRLVVRDGKGRVTGVLSFGGILRRETSAEDIANVVKHAVGAERAEISGTRK